MEKMDLQAQMERYRQQMMDFARRAGQLGGGTASNTTVTTSETKPQEMPAEQPQQPEMQALPQVLQITPPVVKNEQTPVPAIPKAEQPQPIAIQEPKAEMKQESAPEEQPTPPTEKQEPYQKILVIDESVPPGQHTVYQYCNEKIPETYEQFLAENPSRGSLKVQVSAAQQSIPISNATVRVTKQIGDSEHEFFIRLTDFDGIVNNMSLPAPPIEISEHPQVRNSDKVPFATYSITVTHPNYEAEERVNIPIFAGIESIQKISMIPVFRR